MAYNNSDSDRRIKIWLLITWTIILLSTVAWAQSCESRQRKQDEITRKHAADAQTACESEGGIPIFRRDFSSGEDEFERCDRPPLR